MELGRTLGRSTNDGIGGGLASGDSLGTEGTQFFLMGKRCFLKSKRNGFFPGLLGGSTQQCCQDGARRESLALHSLGIRQRGDCLRGLNWRKLQRFWGSGQAMRRQRETVTKEPLR